ncbi:FadR family transcriptional regulator [Faecalicatena contorta]|uniref:FadR/GntR family transcriptional regulator n=1 Tax=Faecalicatena contorta TaxID=39482 RepID=UPI001896AE01|nr:FadR family transcriptional regulator [Faecalicatena contorta]
MNEKKEKAKPLAQKAAEEIIKIIKENKMEPGDRLKNEYELAELLNVGRGTVREAIRSLVSKNILEVRQGAGTFVSYKNGIPEDPLGLAFEGLNESLALDMMDVRLMLEPEIAALAAMNATSRQIDLMLEQCQKVEDLIKANMPYRQEDVLFHQRVAECSGNRVVVKLIPVITSSVQLNIGVTRDRYKAQTVTEHRAIAEAIVNHDVYKAKYSMVSHLNILRTGILENQ